MDLMLKKKKGKKRSGLTYGPAIPLLTEVKQVREIITDLKTSVNKKTHGHSVSNSQKLKTAQGPIDRRMGK